MNRAVFLDRDGGRKPSPQFLFDARDEFGIDLSQS
jgi:hypothetical protein